MVYIWNINWANVTTGWQMESFRLLRTAYACGFVCVGVCGSILIHPQIPAGCHLKKNKKKKQLTHQKLEQLEQNLERSAKAL